MHRSHRRELVEVLSNNYYVALLPFLLTSNTSESFNTLFIPTFPSFSFALPPPHVGISMVCTQFSTQVGWTEEDDPIAKRNKALLHLFTPDDWQACPPTTSSVVLQMDGFNNMSGMGMGGGGGGAKKAVHVKVRFFKLMHFLCVNDCEKRGGMQSP